MKKDFKNVKIGDTLIWKHIKFDEYVDKYKYEKLFKHIKVLSIKDDFIKTNFGTYSIITCKNQFDSCGCNRFCDCYGKISLL